MATLRTAITKAVARLKRLKVPDAGSPGFDAWCEQAIALTREPEDVDLTLWERELADADGA